MIEIIFPLRWTPKRCQQYVVEHALLSVTWHYRINPHGKFTCMARVHGV